MKLWRALTVLSLMTLAACAKQAAGEAAPSYAEPPPSSDPLEFYEAQLAENEAALRAQGVELPQVAVAGELAKSGPRTSADAKNVATPSGGAALDATTAGGDAGMVDDADAVVDEEAPTDLPDQAPAAPMEQEELAEAAPEPEEDERRKEARRSRDEQSRVPNRCETICGLAENTCSLEGRICELADEHAGDPRYEDACGRAQGDCEVAQEACHACVE